MIAGNIEDIDINKGEWIFLDIGFSGKKATCGLALPNHDIQCVMFGDAVEKINAAVHNSSQTVNLVIEAPLSVCFSAKGNPQERKIEKSGRHHRYWYEGLGCVVMTAALFLLRELGQSPTENLCLFEGFVSFKPPGRSSHINDVQLLRKIVEEGSRSKSIIPGTADALAVPGGILKSSGCLIGHDFGIPPVLMPKI